MRELSPSTKFKKDFKTVRKYPNFSQKEFEEVLTKLQKGEKLDPKYKDHKMGASGVKYMGYRNLHLKPDIIIIYGLTDKYVDLVRIGKHNDLGITESLS